jgi:transposase InsO family protein
MEEIESSINRYLAALDAADRQEPTASEPGAGRLEEKIAKLKTQMKELQAIEIQLNESPDKQVSLTDPDARSMMTRGTGIVGYNVQTAVDTKNHLIVAHEIAHMLKPDRETALRNLAIAFERYNEEQPHRALKYRSPREFSAWRRHQLNGELVSSFIREESTENSSSLIG